jgi:hypothetical protein
MVFPSRGQLMVDIIQELIHDEGLHGKNGRNFICIKHSNNSRHQNVIDVMDI